MALKKRDRYFWLTYFWVVCELEQLPRSKSAVVYCQLSRPPETPAKFLLAPLFAPHFINPHSLNPTRSRLFAVSILFSPGPGILYSRSGVAFSLHSSACFYRAWIRRCFYPLCRSTDSQIARHVLPAVRTKDWRRFTGCDLKMGQWPVEATEVD